MWMKWQDNLVVVGVSITGQGRHGGSRFMRLSAVVLEYFVGLFVVVVLDQWLSRPGFIDFILAITWSSFFVGPELTYHLGRFLIYVDGCSFYVCQQNCEKWLLSFVMSVYSSYCLCFSLSAWNYSAPTGWIFVKFDIWVFFKNLSRKLKIH